jgi:hypothetical protein
VYEGQAIPEGILCCGNGEIQNGEHCTCLRVTPKSWSKPVVTTVTRKRDKIKRILSYQSSSRANLKSLKCDQSRHPRDELSSEVQAISKPT